jgi:tryptophan synthase alpha chain
MNRIASAFEGKKTFIAYLTAGDPSLLKTAEYIRAMARAGADLIEIGIPFSDPIAEGPVIEKASERALLGGALTDGIFRMVEEVRRDVSVPLVFMSYINPIFVYGAQRFFAECARVGIDGVIVPDLPMEERGELLPAATAHGISLIAMVAPTSGNRIGKIAEGAQGFLYCVSSMGVTGVRDSIDTDLYALVGAAKKATDLPVAVGFGVSTPAQAQNIAEIADGVIVGSAIVRIIAQHGENAAEPLAKYVAQMKQAMGQA